MSKIILILSIILAVTIAQQCKILVMEGGGDLGAYEAGVIYGLINNLDAESVKWDILSGVSVGAMNSAGFASFPIGQEKQAADYILQMWRSIASNKIYKNWPLGLLNGLTSQKGLYNTQPLKDYLSSEIKSPQRKISILATNANTGEPKRWDETNSQPDLVLGLMASTAVPVAFPYQTINNTNYFDGGVYSMIDFGAAINRCRSSGFADNKIVVDAIFIGKGALSNWPVSTDYKTMGVYSRSQEIQTYVKAVMEYIQAYENSPSINFRYIINPSTKLPGADIPLDFNAKDTETMINQGIADAISAINSGSQGNANEVYLSLKTELRNFQRKYQ